jgi:hypothetical protein
MFGFGLVELVIVAAILLIGLLIFALRSVRRK